MSRKEFEVSCLFNPLVQGRGRFLKRKKGDTEVYESIEAEAMYQGYQMAKDRDFAQLKRFDPDRFIGNGHITEINDGEEIRITASMIRRVLKVVAGWPS